MPETGLYHMDDAEFQRGESYRRIAHSDRVLSQICTDIHSVEMLKQEKYVKPEATVLMPSPTQMAIRNLWNTGVISRSCLRGYPAPGIRESGDRCSELKCDNCAS